MELVTGKISLARAIWEGFLEEVTFKRRPEWQECKASCSPWPELQLFEGRAWSDSSPGPGMEQGSINIRGVTKQMGELPLRINCIFGSHLLPFCSLDDKLSWYAWLMFPGCATGRERVNGRELINSHESIASWILESLFRPCLPVFCRVGKV